MKSSYKPEDVTMLIKDLTGKVEPVSLEERAKRVANGEFERSIMIKEYPVSKEYLDIAEKMGKSHISTVARLVENVSEKIYADKGESVVLVSIIRAGIPVGILIKRYLKLKYGIDVPHYAVSLVKGLDDNAMKYILKRHNAECIQFIDGWTGKGTVTDELVESAKHYKGVDASLAVLCDPIYTAKLAGCYSDVYIPSAPFNACCTGLVSITIFNNEYVGEDDFHGAVYLEELESIDKSEEFLNAVTSLLKPIEAYDNSNDVPVSRVNEVNAVAEVLDVSTKKLNPGINEAARAILRRKLDRLLISSYTDENDPELETIIALAKLKGAKIESYPLCYYKAISVAVD